MAQQQQWQLHVLITHTDSNTSMKHKPTTHSCRYILNNQPRPMVCFHRKLRFHHKHMMAPCAIILSGVSTILYIQWAMIAHTTFLLQSIPTPTLHNYPLMSPTNNCETACLGIYLISFHSTINYYRVRYHKTIVFKQLLLPAVLLANNHSNIAHIKVTKTQYIALNTAHQFTPHLLVIHLQ